MRLFSRKKEQSPYHSYRFGTWLLEFYYNEDNEQETYLKIQTIAGGEKGFMLIIPSTMHTYGYLLAALEKNMHNQLEGFTLLLYTVASLITMDSDFCEDIQHAIEKWSDKVDKMARSNAKKVTNTEEAANQALMEELVADAETPEVERELRHEANKALMREIVDEVLNSAEDNAEIAPKKPKTTRKGKNKGLKKE